MSGLTPEAARAAAEWLESRSPSMAFDLREEADRLEAAAKTPGQVLYESIASGQWCRLDDGARAVWEERAAAVIAHHVGPDRVVVDRADIQFAADVLGHKGNSVAGDLLREALS